MITPIESMAKDESEKYRPKPKENQKKRVTNRFVEFTPEIKIWYSWSNGRGRYAYYAIPNRKQCYTGLPRGLRLFGPKEYKSKKENKKKMVEKVFNEDLAKIIVKDVKEHYKNKSITLKSYWFCLRQSLLDSKGEKYNDEQMQQIMSVQYIANLHTDDLDIDIEKILKSLEILYGKKSKKIRTALVQLNILFQRANTDEIFMMQPVSRCQNNIFVLANFQDDLLRYARKKWCKSQVEMLSNAIDSVCSCNDNKLADKIN